MSNIRSVDDVFAFDDSDGTAIDAIRTIREANPELTIVFANGGDRTSENIPERNCGDKDVEYVFGVGGYEKKNSSSWILKKWNEV